MGLQPFRAALRLPDVTEDLRFREFFAAEYGRLRHLGFLLTGDWVQAEELAQDALVRVYRVWPRVRRLEHPSAYARRVLVNRHRSLLRRALTEARRAMLTHGREAYLPDLGEDAMLLWAAVRDLPPRQRAVLVLRFHEDLTEAEAERPGGGRSRPRRVVRAKGASGQAGRAWLSGSLLPDVEVA
jgi:RNA polymerase sigma factor (sigma-70 family)